MLMKKLCFDRKIEFLKKKIAEWMKEEGPYSEITILYWPDQNRIAECTNCIVIECIQAIFIEINLLKNL